MTLTLPKYELYEEGSQVRRSSKSIVANIVEGYGRRRYKAEFIKFLIYAHSSCDETILHLKMIQKTPLLKETLSEMITDYNELGRKINKFIQYVENEWR